MGVLSRLLRLSNDGRYLTNEQLRQASMSQNQREHERRMEEITERRKLRELRGY